MINFITKRILNNQIVKIRFIPDIISKFQLERVLIKVIKYKIYFLAKFYKIIH